MVQSLSLLAANAKHKVWLKPTLEMAFLNGNHVLKGGLGRITENIAPGNRVVVFSMSDVPFGFGISAKSTQDCRKLDPNGIVVLHQADIGEYLRKVLRFLGGFGKWKAPDRKDRKKGELSVKVPIIGTDLSSIILQFNCTINFQFLFPEHLLCGFILN
ncbi:hypothetical protein SO802_002412 [Lithocarpus litseifolius]|uniref:PUA domain-containing protein n=1 Tax=Lithocarpus litseifolius TaxID=425828 RepID=A0AAW2E0P3_9ROSI